MRSSIINDYDLIIINTHNLEPFCLFNRHKNDKLISKAKEFPINFSTYPYIPSLDYNIHKIFFTNKNKRRSKDRWHCPRSCSFVNKLIFLGIVRITKLNVVVFMLMFVTLWCNNASKFNQAWIILLECFIL